ncbi:MAG: hypothetical protein HDS14_03605 [Bacteroides sp.]|nr:hypothetical protein [Bacteroides sp.]
MLILKTILLLIILTGMIVLLLSVRLLANPTEDADKENTAKLRRDLDIESSVVPYNSLFHRFLARDRKKG